MASQRIFNMFTLSETLEDSHELTDMYYQAIKECPFDRTKDLSDWADSKILFDMVTNHFMTEVGQDMEIQERRINIKDPDPTVSDDLNSYLVVELVIAGASGRLRLILNYPVNY